MSLKQLLYDKTEGEEGWPTFLKAHFHRIIPVCALLNTPPAPSLHTPLQTVPWPQHPVFSQPCWRASRGQRGCSHGRREPAETGSGLHKVCEAERTTDGSTAGSRAVKGPWTPLNRWHQRRVEAALAPCWKDNRADTAGGRFWCFLL